MKRNRVLWAVVPKPGIFRWAVTRNGITQRDFLFKYSAIDFAVGECNFDWQEYQIPSELTIRGRNGRIQDARTYGDDPREIPG